MGAHPQLPATDSRAYLAVAVLPVLAAGVGIMRQLSGISGEFTRAGGCRGKTEAGVDTVCTEQVRILPRPLAVWPDEEKEMIIMLDHHFFLAGIVATLILAILLYLAAHYYTHP